MGRAVLVIFTLLPLATTLCCGDAGVHEVVSRVLTLVVASDESTPYPPHRPVELPNNAKLCGSIVMESWLLWGISALSGFQCATAAHFAELVDHVESSDRPVEAQYV